MPSYSEKRKVSYYDQLKDPRWQEVRLRVLERAEFRCETCGEKPQLESLDIHHRYYQSGLMVWDYPLDSLLCLCKSCHDEVADGERRLLRSIDPHDGRHVLGFAYEIFLANSVGIGLADCTRAIHEAVIKKSHDINKGGL